VGSIRIQGNNGNGMLFLDLSSCLSPLLLWSPPSKFPTVNSLLWTSTPSVEQPTLWALTANDTFTLLGPMFLKIIFYGTIPSKMPMLWTGVNGP
jgi:hypothetical protein